MEKNNNFILYDGASGVQMKTSVFMGPVFGMRLKHMTEDKWNARAEGRREQKTRQPTGGRGQQGGLRIGEMERDALAGHGISGFLRESLMERADKTQLRICNGCGTVPIYNDAQNLMVCSLCDGPVQYIGTNSTNIEILPAAAKTLATTSVVEMPYATKLLADELQTYMNMGLRIITEKGLAKLKEPMMDIPIGLEDIRAALSRPLPERVLPEPRVPEFRELGPEDQEEVAEAEAAEEDLYAMGVVGNPTQSGREVEIDDTVDYVPTGPSAATATAANERLKTQEDMNNDKDYPYAPVTPPDVYEQRMAQIAQEKPVQQGGYVPMQQPMQMQPMQMQPMQQPMQMQPMQQPMQQMQPMSQPMQPIPMQQPMQMQQMQPMQMQQGGYQYVTPAPIVYQGTVPGAPPTIVIDSGTRAMHNMDEGYSEDMQLAARGVPVMGSGGGAGGRRRNTTPRARAQSPKTFGGKEVGGSSIITVNKLG
jgi:hypothetical protein